MRLYLSGIGGIGLSAYAAHMKAEGHEIFGSDRVSSDLINDLRSQDIEITLKQDGSGLPDGLDLLVYSEAIPEQSPERIEAEKRGVRQISYFHAVGEMTNGKNLICVCGTHGKSSTTAMLALALVDAGLDPSVIVGTKVPQLNGKNWRRGAGDLWIVEACEYRRSFLHLHPRTILITNADGDHFDAFDGESDYQKAFVEFLGNLPKDGVVIAHGEDEESMEIVKSSRKTFIDADQEPLSALSVPGVHMQKNAQLVQALGKLLKIDDEKLRASLKSYSGSWRRMEVKGTTKEGITVVDDYAHHPTELKATLAAMRFAHAGRRIVCVFQPHTHDRTLKLWNDFASAFKDADQIVITNVYDARPDRDSERVDETAFANIISEKSGRPCILSGSLQETERMLKGGILHANDVLLFAGAGDITSLATAFAA